MLEKVIEAKVCEYARSKGMMALKFNSMNRAAVPDRIFLYRGKVFFVEFKREGCLPTPAQSREHARIEEQGIDVYVVDNVEQGKRVIDAYA